MRNVLVTLLIWIFFLFSLFITFPFFILLWMYSLLANRGLTALHRLTGKWAGVLLKINPFWGYTLYGCEKLQSKTVAIYICNHQSLLDTFLLYQLDFPFRFVSKSELFKIPIIGLIMKMNRYVPVIRGDKASRDELMNHCSRLLRSGISIMIFPEGSRSPNGDMQVFKKGAFELALENKVNLQPIVISGSYDAIPKKGFLLHPSPNMKVKLLDTILYHQFKDKNAEALSSEVFEIMNNALILLTHSAEA